MQFFYLLYLIFDAIACEIILGSIIDGLGNATEHDSDIFLLFFKFIPDIYLLDLELLYLFVQYYFGVVAFLE